MPRRSLSVVQVWTMKSGKGQRQTLVFNVFCLTQLGHVLAIRSERESLFRTGLFSNKYLLGAVVLTFALQMATLYVPFLNPIFKTEFLSLDDLILVVVLSSVVLIAVEIGKVLERRLSRNANRRPCMGNIKKGGDLTIYRFNINRLLL